MVEDNTSVDATVTMIAIRSDQTVIWQTTNARPHPAKFWSTQSRSTQTPALDALQQPKVWS